MKLKGKVFFVLSSILIGLSACGNEISSSNSIISNSVNSISSISSISSNSVNNGTSSNSINHTTTSEASIDSVTSLISSNSEESISISSDSVLKNYNISTFADSSISFEFEDSIEGTCQEGKIVKFKVTSNNEDIVVDKVEIAYQEQKQILECVDDKYSFTMPSSDVTITVKTLTKHSITKAGAEHISFNIIGKNEKFLKDEEVTFSASPFGGYKITNVSIATESGVNVNYTYESYYTFIMPDENVVITFAEEKLYEISTENSEHISINIDTSKTYYEVGSEVSFTLSISSEIYEVDTLSVTSSVGSTSETVSYVENEGTYTFTMPEGNVKIAVTEKTVAALNDDPFTTVISFQGDWDYWDSYTDYTMYYRIVFNGDKTLSWYLNYTYYEEEWINLSSSIGPSIKKSIPTDLPGSNRESQENVPYIYHRDTDTITYTTPKGRSTVDCTLEIIRNSDDNQITAVKHLNNLGGEFYQTKDILLNIR